jgi:FlaA1/EpsC-like NDP-sugar epimerase
MIRLLNVYYPTRTVILLLCEALIVCGSFAVASLVVLGPSTMDVLSDHHGILKIAVLTVITILCAYYFDLYEPQQLSAPWEIYFRLLLVVGCLSLLLSLVMFMFPQVDIARYVFLLGLALVVTFLILWRRTFEWISGRAMFHERVFVLGNGPSPPTSSRPSATARKPAWRSSITTARSSIWATARTLTMRSSSVSLR